MRFLHLFKFGLVVLEKSNSSRRRQADSLPYFFVVLRIPATWRFRRPAIAAGSGSCCAFRLRSPPMWVPRPDRGRFPASIPSCRFRPTAAVPPLRWRWSRRSPRKPPCTIAGGTISSRSAAMFEGRGPSGRDVACHIYNLRCAFPAMLRAARVFRSNGRRFGRDEPPTGCFSFSILFGDKSNGLRGERKQNT